MSENRSNEQGFGVVLGLRLCAWLLDYPAGLLLLTCWFGLTLRRAQIWEYFGVTLICAFLWWLGRTHLTWWRDRRRVIRAWQGTAWSTGIAELLGLVNGTGSVPRLKKYEVGDGLRNFTFRLVPGVTVEQFEEVRPALADALGAHRCEVFKASPGWVGVRVIDRDSMTETRSAEWTKGIATQQESMDGLPDGSRPWYERGDDIL